MNDINQTYKQLKRELKEVRYAKLNELDSPELI